MSDYDIYILILCIIVFVVLTTLSVACVAAIVKMYKRLIMCGEADAQIKKEYEKMSGKSKVGDVFAFIFDLIVGIVVIAAFAFSLYVNTQTTSVSDTAPTLRVVESNSMSEKYSANAYLYENDLNEQFSYCDVVLTYKMPDEYELELYDIVVYELNGTLIIHRIVRIEEPNENHPDCRYFYLRGDANSANDGYAVVYSQMRGIYRGERVRYVGSLILFFQSPAGWLCVLLIVAAVIGAPMIENYIGNLKRRRFIDSGMMTGLDTSETSEAVVVQRVPYNLRGEGFYDLVEVDDDGTVRTVQSEDEHGRRRK